MNPPFLTVARHSLLPKQVRTGMRGLALSVVFLSLLAAGLVMVRRASAVNGTFTVGPTGTYATLTAAFTAINGGGGADGPIVLELQPTYVSTSETFPIVPTVSGNSPINTITIRPAAGATNLTITSANTTATIDLNGAQNVIFDGQPGGTGGTKQLTIQNTSTSGVAIRFINEAQSNTIKYCTIRGVTTSASSGVVFFSTTTGANGNDNNTIDNCDIRDGATTPANGIFSSGTSTTAAQNNSGNTISNNNIFNFFSNTVTIGTGVLISSGSTDWIITGNSFYQTTTRTFSVALAGLIGISVNNTSGNNFTINNNFIGGSAPSAGSTAWTQTGAVTHTFIGLRMSVGTTAASNVQGNTIQNISISTSTVSAINAGISAVTGSVNIGTTAANTIGSTSVNGSITFTGAGSGAQLTGILAGTGTPGVIAISNNSIGGFTVAGAGTTILRGINVQAAATSYTISGNTIGSTSTANNISNSTNNSVGGIISSSSSGSVTISNNTVANLTTSGTSTANQLVGVSTTGGVNTITGNTVRNLSSTSTSTSGNSTAAVIGISQTSTTGGQTISQNTVHSISDSAAAAAVNVIGINYAGPTTGTNLISRNFIHSFSTTSTAALQQGINTNGSGIGTFQNNMVRLGIDASGSSITSSAAITGLLKASTGNSNFYFNSVFIGGTGVASGAVNTFAFRRTATTIDDFRDNVFVNARSNASGTGKHFAYVLNATTTVTSDYNIYLASGTGGVLASVDTGTTSLVTLANLQSATGQDSHSQSADPLFINPTGTSATVDLHIQTGPATPVEGLGADIPSITDDFDGNIRNNFTPVDIGADAGAFVSTDVTPPVISYAPLSSPTPSLANRTLTATIVDATGVPTSGSFVPRIYYKKNADPYFSRPGTLFSGNGQSGTWNFTIVVADMGGVGGGDTISYFVIAQDRVGNLASNPSGVVASDVNTVITPPSTPNTYFIPSISGTFNVGAGGDYTTLTAAVAAYNAAAQNGPVTFRLTDANYSSETFPITINANDGSSSTNILTIVPASGVSPTISGSSGTTDTSIFKLNGADYVVIDGSNNGSATRDLTILNTSLNPSTAVVWLSSKGSGAGATNNVIKNCNLAAGANQSSNTTATFGVISSGTSANATNDGADNDNNTFTNNSITKVRYGIFLRGASANTNDGNIVSGNRIGPTSFGTDEIGTDGIVIQHQNLANVTQNEVRFVGGNQANRSSSSTLKAIGIGVGSETWQPTATVVTNSTVTRNLIHDVVDEQTGSAVGIVVAGTGSPSANIVANNMLYNLHSNGTGSNQTVGIGISAGNGDKVTFNTVSLTGDLDPPGTPPTTTTTQSAVGIRITGAPTATNLTLKNNIVSADVNSNAKNPALHHFAIVAPASYPWGTGGANNNDYYVNPANPQMVLGGIGITVPYTDVTTLSAWRTQFSPSQDAASQNTNPPFVSAADLHLSTSTTTTLESGGTPITGVTDDFDGDIRNAGVPDIGADEGAFMAAFANDVAASSFIDPADAGTKQAGVSFAPQATFANAGTAGQSNIPVRYRILDAGNAEVYNQTTTIASLPFGSTATATFPTATIASAGTYTIIAKAELVGDGNALNDQISGSITVVTPITGSHTIGTGQEYASVTAALTDLNARGVSGPVTLALTSTYTSASETFPITVNPILGASSTNTITIKPDTGVSPTISGSSSSCVLKLNGADYIVVDGSNTIGGTGRDLTINNTNNATNTAAICLVSLGAGAGSTNNTIKNTNISTGVDQTSNADNVSFAILSGGAVVTTTSDGPDNDNNTFANNLITKARYGIFLRGKALNLNDGNTISGNLIGPAAFGDSEIGVAGVTLQYQNSATVTQNEVRFVGAQLADTGFDNTRAGIAIGGRGLSPWQPTSPTNVTNSSITRNLIHDIVDEHEFSAVAIILAGLGVPSNNVVANNMIYGIRSNGTTGDQALGIGVAAGDGDKIVFNSVSLTGDMDPAGTVATTGSAAALRIDSAAASDLTLLDNILAADVTSNTPSLKHYTIEAPGTSYSWGTGGANNNDFYFNGSNSQMALGGLGEPPTDATFTTVSTLASWQTTFTPNQDSSSISANPLFVSGTNLHLSSASSPASNAGVAVPGVTTDFDGDNRDVSTPEIGADELAVNFSSAGNGNLPGGTYNNITINGPDTITVTGNITASTAIIVKNGATLNCGAFIISGSATFLIEAGGTLGVGDPNGISASGASGNIQVTGSRTYTAGSNYIYNGTIAQITGNGLPSSVNNLTTTNSAGVNLSQNVTVGGTLALTGGDFITGAFAITENGTSDPASTGDVVGNVIRTDLTTTAKQFGNPNNQITINSGSITTMTMNLDKGERPTDFIQSVLRNYTLTPDAGSLTQATVRLHYLDSELNGNIEDSTLHLWRRDGSWTDVGQSAADSANNWVEYNNVTGFSPWTISGPSAPTAVRLTRFDAASYSDGVSLTWESGYEVNNLGYQLYREENGRRTRVTPAIVAGSALKVGRNAKLTAGYSYSWFDRQGTPGTAYYLEAIDLNGQRELNGPVYPSRGNGQSPGANKQVATLLREVGTTPLATFEQSWPASSHHTPGASIRTGLSPKQFGAASPEARQQAIAAAQAVKIAVTHDGWYRVTQPQLVAAGFDVSSDARRLQLFVEGQEVPMALNGSDQNHIGPTDSLEFYGVGLNTLNTDTHVYWLINGPSAGKRINIPNRVVGMADEPKLVEGGSFMMTTQRREKVIYFAGLLNGEAENIFGPVVSTDPATQTLTIKNVDTDAPQATLAVTLQGLTDVHHEVQVQLNGTAIGNIVFDGREHPSQDFSVNRSLLQDGANVITLTSTAGDIDVSLVDSVALTYAHTYRADGNSLSFTVTGPQSVVVSGFDSAAIRLIDITNASVPNELPTTVAALDGGYAFQFQNTAAGTRTYLAFTDALASSAASVTGNQPSSLNLPQSADMLIVTHRDFRSAVEPLAAQRRSEGLAVAVVDIEDVYDEFSFGTHTPYALHDFLNWTRSHWTRAPRYLLLVGDSSWDPRNYLDQGFGDFVPTKLIDTAYMETASDDWLADFDNDGVADIAIGRLPVRSLAETQRMVSRILAYEHEKQLGLPTRGALLVADTGFESESSATASLMLPGMAVESINRSAIGSDDVTRERIVTGINNGPLVVNYLGHGSVTVWTGAGLLDSSLASGLTNNDKPSVFILMTCLNGYTHDAYIDSLAEALLKADSGGAMAVWASSGFTEGQPQFGMNTQFYQQLFSSASTRLGDAAMVAKKATADPDVRRTWMLFGDPTMRLR